MSVRQGSRVRLFASLVTLVTVIVAGRAVTSLSPRDAAALGSLLALLTYAALGVRPRAGFLLRLRGRRLQVYFGVLGVTMGLFGLLLPLLPGMEAGRTVSIVLLVCAMVYILAAMIGFRRPLDRIGGDD